MNRKLFAIGWANNKARQRYENLLSHLNHYAERTPSHEGVSEVLPAAELNIILGKPLLGLSTLRTKTVPQPLRATQRVLQARALHTMRLSEAAAQLLYHAISRENLSDNYELCIMLARMNYYLACNTKEPTQAKRDIEAAVSTTRLCIRLQPDKPDAYALLARITAQYPEGIRFSDEAYEHFKAAIQAHPRINWMVAADITYTHWLRGRFEDMSVWRDRWCEILDKNLWRADCVPFNPDRFAFSALAEIFRLCGVPDAFEEYLQTAFLLYPSKSAQLIRYYMRRLCLRKFGHSLRLFLRSVDKQEARLRYAYMRSNPSERAKLIYELTNIIA